jgi:hypothetical protein
MASSRHPAVPLSVCETASGLAAILVLLAYAFVLWECCFGPWNTANLQAESAQNRQWATHTATVVWVDRSKTQYSAVVMRYTDFFGVSRTTSIKEMPSRDVVGSREPVLVGADNEARFVNDPVVPYLDPRTYGSSSLILAGIFGGISMIVPCWYILKRLLIGLYWLGRALQLRRLRPGLR